MATLVRLPRPVEQATARRLIFKAPCVKDGVEDLLRTLLNSGGFPYSY